MPIGRFKHPYPLCTQAAGSWCIGRASIDHGASPVLSAHTRLTEDPSMCCPLSSGNPEPRQEAQGRPRLKTRSQPRREHWHSRKNCSPPITQLPRPDTMVRPVLLISLLSAHREPLRHPVWTGPTDNGSSFKARPQPRPTLRLLQTQRTSTWTTMNLAVVREPPLPPSLRQRFDRRRAPCGSSRCRCSADRRYRRTTSASPYLVSP